MAAPTSLLEMICSWDVDDIMADNQAKNVCPPHTNQMNLLLDKIKSTKVPRVLVSFECAKEFGRTCSCLVVQDCRAIVKASLQNIESSLSYSVKHILPTKSKSHHFIDIDLSLDPKGNYHVAREGDLFLFSHYSPQQEGFEYGYRSFGIASNISRHSKFHQGFEAQTPKKFKVFHYATFLTNVTAFSNAWNAVNLDNAESNCARVISIMNLPKSPNTDYTHGSKTVGLPNAVFGNLSDEQKNIASSVAREVQCKDTKIVKLLGGPPRSGKTVIITEVLHLLHCSPVKTLICVPSENDVISFMIILEESGYQLNDILVLDNLEGREVSKKVRQACLQDRSHDLLCCIQMFRHWASDMLLLLKLKTFCTEKCNHESLKRCSKNSLPIFKLEVFRTRFCTLMTDMEECLVELKDRFSEICLTKENVNGIGKLLDTLKDLHRLLLDEIKDEKSVHLAFGLVPNSPFLHECPAAEELNRVRLECSRDLETLKDSVTLPKHFDDRKEIEDYCIEKCQVIVGTTSSTVRVHQSNQIDLLIVDNASDIKLYNLIIPLRLSVRHVWMLGDDNKQPDRMGGNDEISNNTFQRLLHLGFPMDKLTERFLIDPAIFEFPNKYFYGGILDGPNVRTPHDNKQLRSLSLSKYLYMDVSDKDRSVDDDSVEEDVVLYMLLKALYKCWVGVSMKLDVAVVCLDNSHADAVKRCLVNKQGTQERINLHVKCADSLEGEMYDVIIMSALSKDHEKFVEDRHIMSAITKARYCLWTLVDHLQYHGVLREMLSDARKRNCLTWLTVAKDQLEETNNFADLFGGNPASQMADCIRLDNIIFVPYRYLHTSCSIGNNGVFEEIPNIRLSLRRTLEKKRIWHKGVGDALRLVYTLFKSTLQPKFDRREISL
ncbi:uncharacterized protein [Triticum aestivum]|uniref:uncharacterized protein n=1 Tax=Triticum aestivum TaxID=4565 RepID=UPI001D01EEBE|nr:uncharacterized protein LOC123158592 [Triticum aestivum]